jgi:hypothetical protein
MPLRHGLGSDALLCHLLPVRLRNCVLPGGLLVLRPASLNPEAILRHALLLLTCLLLLSDDAAGATGPHQAIVGAIPRPALPLALPPGWYPRSLLRVTYPLPLLPMQAFAELPVNTSPPIT